MDVKDTTEETTPKFYDLEGRLAGAKDRFMEILKPADDLKNAILGTGDAVETTDKKFGSMDIAADNTKMTMQDFNAQFLDTKEKMDGPASSSDTFTSALDAVNAGMGRTTGEA